MGKQLPHLLEKRSSYVEIRDEFLNLKNYEKTKDLDVDFSDVEFEIELLKTDEIILDYILFIDKSIQRGYAENNGTDLDSIIPPTSRRQGARERKKQEVLRKIQLLVETYSGI